MAIYAFVVMPDHLHLLLTPAPEVSLEEAMQFLKGGFSFQLKHLQNIWQRSFNEQRISDADDYARHRSYTEAYPYPSVSLHHGGRSGSVASHALPRRANSDRNQLDRDKA